MTWREEAKELGVPLYDHKLNKVRKKVDVLTDISNKSIPKLDEPVNIIIDLVEVNAIFRQALLDHGTKIGLTNVSIEGCIESLIRKRKLISCKRRGIILKGMRDGDRERTSEGTESESEGTGPDIPSGVRESERESSPERTEETVGV